MLDSLAALQGPFCISVRVALFTLLLHQLFQLGLLAIFANVIWDLFLDSLPLVFSALLRFVFWGVMLCGFQASNTV